MGQRSRITHGPAERHHPAKPDRFRPYRVESLFFAFSEEFRRIGGSPGGQDPFGCGPVAGGRVAKRF